MKGTRSSALAVLGGVFGLLLSVHPPLHAQVVTYCPASKFYQYPRNVTPITPEVPAGGIGMVSASDIKSILDRDPHRITGWVEVFVVNGRGGDPRGPYWMTEKDFRCGKFMGV